jgi:hypothetical protein
MGQADLVTEMPAIRSERTLSSSLVILIEVPAIKARPIDRSSRTPSLRTRVVGRKPHRYRRRLRREVRLVGCALLALVPIVSACTLGWSNRPDRNLACSISDPLEARADGDGFVDPPSLGLRHQPGQSTVASTGAVVLSIESAVTVPGAVSDTAVIFPGYVLPDDSREDSTHEGS